MTDLSLVEKTKAERALDAARQLLGAVGDLSDEVAEHRRRLIQVEHQLEKEVYISPSQAAALLRAVRERVREVCGDKYGELRGKMFPAIWNAVKKEFDVAQYREIPRVKIDIAMKLVREWKPLDLAA
jgi:hypothetical protein